MAKKFEKMSWRRKSITSGFEKKEQIEMYNQIRSAWWDNNALESLSIAEITKHINSKYRDKRHNELSIDAVRNRVNKCVEKGLLLKTKNNRYIVKDVETGDFFKPAVDIRRAWFIIHPPIEILLRLQA